MTDPTAPLSDYLQRLADSTTIVDDLDGVITGRPSSSTGKRNATPRRALLVRAAAVVLVLAGIGALIVASRLGHTPAASNGATMQPAVTPELLWPDQTRDFEPVSLDADARDEHESGAGAERIYSVPGTTIGTGPTLSVMTFDAQQIEPQVETGAVDLVIRDTPAAVWAPHPNQERVRFGPIDGQWYLITGHNMERATMLALAETATPSQDQFGAVIDTTTDSLGLRESATGERFGNTFIPRSALDRPVRQAAWTNGASSFEYFVTANPVEEAAGARIGAGREPFDTVRDITINGTTGFIANGSNIVQSYVVISWSTPTETVTLKSRNMSETDSLAIAESLRAAHNDEWRAESVPTTTTP